MNTPTDTSYHCFTPRDSMQVLSLTPLYVSLHTQGKQQVQCSPDYPKGNFGGNQLLDGSMSLSPLLATKGGNDLHVSSAHNASFHQNFF